MQIGNRNTGQDVFLGGLAQAGALDRGHLYPLFPSPGTGGSSGNQVGDRSLKDLGLEAGQALADTDEQV